MFFSFPFDVGQRRTARTRSIASKKNINCRWWKGVRHSIIETGGLELTIWTSGVRCKKWTHVTCTPVEERFYSGPLSSRLLAVQRPRMEKFRLKSVAKQFPQRTTRSTQMDEERILWGIWWPRIQLRNSFVAATYLMFHVKVINRKSLSGREHGIFIEYPSPNWKMRYSFIAIQSDCYAATLPRKRVAIIVRWWKNKIGSIKLNFRPLTFI